jgi:hypothetical protein
MKNKQTNKQTFPVPHTGNGSKDSPDEILKTAAS